MDTSANSEQISEARARSNANLKPWPKGVSGNRSGRPKKSLLDRQIDKLLKSRCVEDPQQRKFAELIAYALVRDAIKGGTAGVAAAHLLAERSGGKVVAQDEALPITDIRCTIHVNRPVLRDGLEPPTIKGQI